MSVIKYLAAGAALAMFCTLGVVHPAAAQTSSPRAKRSGSWISRPRARTARRLSAQI